MKSFTIATWICALALPLTSQAHTDTEGLYWIKLEAKDKYERSAIANTGVTIETIDPEYVIALGTKAELDTLQKEHKVLTAFKEVETLDFPKEDSQFHNYTEMTEAMRTLATQNPDLVSLDVIGKSLEGRDMLALTITSNQEGHLEQPGMILVGGHHAREHLSMEIPLMTAQKLVADYRAGDARVKGYLDTRSIYIIPVVNPDGSEYDIESGRYRSWRKNRRQNSNGTYGVDLNRNYGFKWGTVGMSHNPSSDTYCGTEAFSEPETQTIKAFYEARPNVTVNLSIHTFSKLILYPWGHTYDSINKDTDLQVHSTMAERMAQWNGYTPQQSSDLYLTSGDTSDWAYGEKGLVSFTFELDPSSIFEGGFYPGQSYIQPVFQKNWEPILYLLEYTDNPYRVLKGQHEELGFTNAIF